MQCEKTTLETFQLPAPGTSKPTLRVIPGGGLDLFMCPHQSGNLRLTKSGCAKLFRRAQSTDLELEPQLSACRECRIGQQHAGMKSIKPAAPRVCVRCENRGSGLRLVGRLLCVSCWNRNAEFIHQKNARGAPPAHFQPLRLYQHESRLIIARDPEEAKRVALRMWGHFNREFLTDLGTATPMDVARWWNDVVKPFSRHCYKPHDLKLTTARNVNHG